jgi:hypothetical protein
MFIDSRILDDDGLSFLVTGTKYLEYISSIRIISNSQTVAEQLSNNNQTAIEIKQLKKRYRTVQN